MPIVGIKRSQIDDLSFHPKEQEVKKKLKLSKRKEKCWSQSNEKGNRKNRENPKPKASSLRI